MSGSSKNHGLSPSMNDRIVQAFVLEEIIETNDPNFDLIRKQHTHWVSDSDVKIKKPGGSLEIIIPAWTVLGLKNVQFTDSGSKKLVLM